MKKYKYKISVVIPIYKVEDYLKETIDSVINQTMGLKDIQIILVNDGSPDNSEAICLDYKEKYPDNIVYVKQENAGVSAARNNGIKYVEGKYVNFLDSDDKWEKDVFKKAWKMFEAHEEIDVIGVRQKFFEASEKYPPLDFKFDKDKVINIMKDYDHIQLSVTSAFIRVDSIGNIRYDTRVKYSEDSKFLYEIILKKEHLGLIASSVHLYRKRLSYDSAIQTKIGKDDWYLITPTLCYEYVYELSRKKYGYVIPFVQYYVAYEYQWRIKDKIPSDISEDVKNKYFEITKRLLNEIDDSIMMEQRHFFSEYKIKYLYDKYGEDNVNKKLNVEDSFLKYKSISLQNLSSPKILNIFSINFSKNEVNIKGKVNLFIDKDLYDVYYVKNGDERCKITLENVKTSSPKVYLSDLLVWHKGFDLTFDLDNLESLAFELQYKDSFRNTLKFTTGLNSKLSPKNKLVYDYKYNHKSLIMYIKNKKIIFKRKRFFNYFLKKLIMLACLVKKKQFKVLMFRLYYNLFKIFKQKKIWLISDRPFSANDNGYAFFKYLCEHPVKGVKPYFIIAKNSKDFDKVKKTGKYLVYNSKKYKTYFLLADKVISSQADDWTNNPFGVNERFYRDLYKYDFIFLQHGIIENNLSNWLNKYSRKIDLFVTTIDKEYNSIINNNEYGYGKDIIKLTGLPRHDLLENKTKNMITIAPTWRASVAKGLNKTTGQREPNPNFKDSDYYKFYNGLINDPEILNTLKEKGYRLQFIVHPSHIANARDFVKNDFVDIETTSVDYSRILSSSKLLVTDYSSIAFDFAYLRKPLLYSQFDRKEFFGQQRIYEKGYFDWNRDGFGPCTTSYDDTVKEIIKFINNDCKLEKKYKDRIEDFFKYNDRNNSKRVLEEILKMDNEKLEK